MCIESHCCYTKKICLWAVSHRIPYFSASAGEHTQPWASLSHSSWQNILCNDYNGICSILVTVSVKKKNVFSFNIESPSVCPNKYTKSFYLFFCLFLFLTDQLQSHLSKIGLQISHLNISLSIGVGVGHIVYCSHVDVTSWVSFLWGFWEVHSQSKYLVSLALTISLPSSAMIPKS